MLNFYNKKKVASIGIHSNLNGAFTKSIDLITTKTIREIKNFSKYLQRVIEISSLENGCIEKN